MSPTEVPALRLPQRNTDLLLREPLPGHSFVPPFKARAYQKTCIPPGSGFGVKTRWILPVVKLKIGRLHL
jgi:hypothetical protein